MKVTEASNIAVSYPTYDRNNLNCGIAHMSVGGFHRSHQARFLDQLLEQSPTNWMIHGIGNLDEDITLVENMNSQENLYSLVERSIDTNTFRVIGSIKELTHAPTNKQKVIDVLSSNEIKIISLTITEKGYCYDAKKNLDPTHPMIVHDLANPNEPISAIGFIYAASKVRKENNGEPFTLMSCDNLPGNGKISSRIILQYARLLDESVANWIEENVSFPNAMVDRITPAPSAQTVEFLKDEFDVDDPCALVSEDFLQWIIEDNFINTRPELEKVGVQFVSDVEPYEKCKVRLLNGSHSALSYISYLTGYREVDTAMSDPLICDFVRRYMDEDITRCVPDVPGVDVDEYKSILIKRFSNPAISDKIQRLAMDGSEKIPNALVPPISFALLNSETFDYLAFALAGWYRYLRATDENGDAIEITDPMSEQLVKMAQENPLDPTGFLSIGTIFGDVANSQTLIARVTHFLEQIDELGTKDALIKLLQQ